MKLTENEKEKDDSDKDVVATALDRFKIAEDAEAEIRRVGLDDLEFRAGRQWPEKIKNERTTEDRPCLVINKIPGQVRQVTNDQRQNRPSIKVHPVDDLADIDTAKIYQGLIKHIEYNSGAEAAFDTAFEGAAIKGFGYWRVNTRYVHPMSFDQEITIDRIRNHFSVYLDPSHKEPDGSDANWGFIFSDVAIDDFKAEYPDSEISYDTFWDTFGDTRRDWVSKETVRVAEYFYKEYEVKTIALLKNGKVIEKDRLKELYPDELPEGFEIVQERESKFPVIKWCKINGLETLEKTTWLGRWIPIVPCYGDELDIDGEVIREGVVRHAKDSQRMYNYWKSTETETIALAPRIPFVVAEGQIPEEYEYEWKTANKKNHAYLTYKSTTHEGQLVPAPQRQVFEPPVQAITQASLLAADDIKSTTGIFDASLGNKSNESSGVAIQRRNQQAQTSNFHLIDNLTRSIRHTGRIIVDLIPKVYDTARAARIIGEEGDQEIVRINQEFQHKGKEVFYDLGKGKYDVVIDTGPSFATKRQEAAQSQEALTRAYPQLMQIAGDLMVKNMDWPGSSEIAERLKKTIDPNLIEDKESGQPLPPKVKAQMNQMNQMIEQLTQQLTAANEDIKTKRIELESKERIEFSKIEFDYKKEMAKINSTEAIEAFRQEIAGINKRLELLRAPELNEFGIQPEPDQFSEQETYNQQPTDGYSSGQPTGEM